jgi:hypothetical protein
MDDFKKWYSNTEHARMSRTDPELEKRKKYLIRYRDTDPACPIFGMKVWAYDEDHAEEIFWESEPAGPMVTLSDDRSDWFIVSIQEVGK